MTLPTTGPLAMSQVASELGLSIQGISLNVAQVRTLAGVASGAVSMANLRGKSAYTPMTVTGVDASQDLGNTGANGTAHISPSVTVANGSGGYTYQWAITSQDGGWTLASANSNPCDMQHGYNRFGAGTFQAILQCTVTDNTGHQVTASNIHASFSYDNGG